MKYNSKFDYRDISDGLKVIRDFLLGRKHNLHGRFPPEISSRTIPPAEIPRGPEVKYSKQFYFDRSYKDSVKPPVVAPVGVGRSDRSSKTKPSTAMRPDAVCFNCAPTPGLPWGWDGHCYYECVPDPPCPPPCPEPPPTPCVPPPPGPKS